MIMDIEKKTVREVGSCNFCDKGTLSESGLGLIFPYQTVWQAVKENGCGMSIRMCNECVKEFKTKTK